MSGRAPSGQALVASDGAQEVSTLTGFDPSRERTPFVHDPERLKANLRNDRVLTTDRPIGKRTAVHRRRVRDVLLEVHGPYCWLCNKHISGEPTLDHIVPRSRGGRNAIANLRLAHARCNEIRGNGPVPELLLTDDMRAALAGEAATAAKTPKSGLVHEHATAKPERPNPTPILPKKERPL